MIKYISAENSHPEVKRNVTEWKMVSEFNDKTRKGDE